MICSMFCTPMLSSLRAHIGRNVGGGSVKKEGKARLTKRDAHKVANLDSVPILQMKEQQSE